ncbi:rCG42394 [Rattus norvegicus]|uniref:RCG42394 n=1 Tax=Rattus norvegicus TaxID=10116 RepID=A6KFX9_RAT|nr:rCG42394 [Rattus norvegicus]
MPLAPATLSILDPHQDSSWISCCCPVSWRFCGCWGTQQMTVNQRDFLLGLSQACSVENGATTEPQEGGY